MAIKVPVRNYKSPNLRKTVEHIKKTYSHPQHLLSSGFLLVAGETLKGFPNLRSVLGYIQEDIDMNGFHMFHVERLFDLNRDKELDVTISKNFTADSLVVKVKVSSRSDRSKPKSERTGI